MSLYIVACVDIANLTLDELVPDNFYDIVIDKGCLDCVLTNSNNTNNSYSNIVKEIYKTMKEESVFYLFSTSKPDKKINVLSSSGVKVTLEVQEISKIMNYA